MASTEYPHHDAEIDRANELVELIRPMLAGASNNTHGGAVTILFAQYLAMNHPDLRAGLAEMLSKSALNLAPIEEALMETRNRHV